jgi:hypothetical protein
MVAGKPATEFISSVGRVLENNFKRERTTACIDSETDPD